VLAATANLDAACRMLGPSNPASMTLSRKS
jgi:hypothetical protein